MGGYGAREGKSVGIPDPLYAQVLYLSDTTSEILLIGLDLLAVDADFTQQLRSEISHLTGIDPAGILVACTHTHSGPDGYASLFSLGELVLVTVPGEPYAQIGLTLKGAFPDRPVLMISYANDYQGYFPMGDLGETYETLKSPWAPDIGRLLVAAMEQIIHEMIA